MYRRPAERAATAVMLGLVLMEAQVVAEAMVALVVSLPVPAWPVVTEATVPQARLAATGPMEALPDRVDLAEMQAGFKLRPLPRAETLAS